MVTEEDTFNSLRRTPLFSLLDEIDSISGLERLGTTDKINEFLKSHGWTCIEFETAMNKNYD